MLSAGQRGTQTLLDYPGLVMEAPAEDQIRLLDVQALDTKLARLAHQRRTLPVLARLAELEQLIGEADRNRVITATRASDLAREVIKAETDVDQVRTRAARNQARVDAGTLTPKDTEAVVNELALLARRQDDLEEVQLALMEEHEAAQQEAAAAAATLEQLTAERTERLAERDRQLKDIEQQARSILADRAKAIAGLDAGLVELYERLRKQRSGLGAAALRAKRCEGCRTELSPVDLAKAMAAPSNQIVRCEECSRILVRVPE
jgi:predicted  nucleic acid-binding Zn-ribbon protein